MTSLNHRSLKLDIELEKSISKEVKKLLNEQSEYNHYLVNGSVKVIPLVSPGGKKYRLSGFSNGPSFETCPVLKKAPKINQFIDSLPGKKFSCRISIMEKETEIFPHRDYFRSLEFGVIRLHVPIQTDPKILFSIEDESYHLSQGYLHYVDISKVHYLNNPVNKKRVHLILDLEVTEELLKLFSMQKIKKNLEYLNWPLLTKRYDLREMSFQLPRDKVPFPLSLNTEKWMFKNIKEKWYLVSAKYKFLIIPTHTGHYYLDAVGPGFFFSMKKNSLRFICCGITSVSRKGIVNSRRSFVIKANRPFREIQPLFERSLNFIQVKHFSDELVLVKKDDASLIYFLNGLSMELWHKKKFFVKGQKELKEARTMLKLGLLEQVHPRHTVTHQPGR